MFLFFRRVAACMVVLVAGLWTGFSASAQERVAGAEAKLFDRENLVAWCVVPFDDRQRSPEQRCEMLQRLGLRRYAYDYRAEHVPTFDAEMAAIKQAGIELVGWWFPTTLNDEARLILDVLKRHEIQTQLWVTGGGPPTNSAAEQRARVQAEAARIRPIAEAAAKIGCRVSLYNHGGWFGEPENQIEVIKALHLPNVGIVYNLHHGHDHVDRFDELLAIMVPHLDCLNLNGTDRRGDQQGRKILPLGEGDLDLPLLQQIVACGYDGPIGILNHTQENAEHRLRKNLEGLESLRQQLSDAQRPDEAAVQDASSYSAAAVEAILAHAAQHGDAGRGLAVFASAQFACSNCHRIGGHGGRVGPQLDRLATDRSPAEIVESVFWPQRTVPPEYQGVAVMTAHGEVIRGYATSGDAKRLVIRDPASGKVHELERDQIEAQQPVGSLMPEGLVEAMTPQQQADLIRFLLSLGFESQWPGDSLAQSLRHVRAHLHGPATFNLTRRPLQPEQWPSWQAAVNRERIYDFYAKQALHFRDRSPRPLLLAEYPGLDGPGNGHWGNQDEETWADDRWNQSDLGSLQAGVLRGDDVTVRRGVCVRLDGASPRAVCFNPETLNYELLWRDGFVKFSSVRSGLMHGLAIDGTAEPLPVDSSAVPLPLEAAQYQGFYRDADRVGFAYRIGGVDYLDVPVMRDGRFERIAQPVKSHPLAAMVRGGAAQWPETIRTKIRLRTGRRPYVIDTIELPFDNPSGSLMYLGDLAFDREGAGYVCTIQGDVWRVTGLDHPSTAATWKRVASGLHQPLGMWIDDDGIFVIGRDQITRLHDLNDDGEADFYECFSSALETSAAGHDYICGLQRDAKGFFYTASGNQGLVRITPDGKTAEVIATGFRNPDGLGLLPDGTLTVPSSEGNWVPASMICEVRPQAAASVEASPGRRPHFGYPGPRDGQLPDLPLVYLPRGLDNSSGGQVAITSDRWGPLQGQLVHLSFGAAAHFLVLRDEVDSVGQGAVVPLPGEFHSGIHRGRFRAHDGQLYVAGSAGWGTYSAADGCLQRVRYTGKPVQMPAGFHVHQNGVRIRFSDELDPELAADPSRHFAQCWNYRYGPGYGSPEYSSQHVGTRGHDTLEIDSVHLLPGGRELFVEIRDLQPVNQLHLYLQVGEDQARELYATVHRMDGPFETFAGYVAREKVIAPHPIEADVALATRSRPNPWRDPIEGAREIRIRCNSDLSYATKSFEVRPGEAIRLTLENPDVVPHNWALIRPGSLQRFGDLTNRLIADPEASLRQYVADTPDVLAYTDIVPAGESTSIHFRAPETPGRYPYLCTFPGHWSVMNGAMLVAP